MGGSAVITVNAVLMAAYASACAFMVCAHIRHPHAALARKNTNCTPAIASPDEKYSHTAMMSTMNHTAQVSIFLLSSRNWASSEPTRITVSVAANEPPSVFVRKSAPAKAAAVAATYASTHRCSTRVTGRVTASARQRIQPYSRAGVR